MEIKIPNTYTVRPFSLEDAGVTVNMLNAYSQAFMGVNQEDLGEDLAWWKASDRNLAEDTRLVLSEDGMPVGYIEFVDLFGDTHANLWCWGCVHPAHLGRGIGRYLLSWVEERARLVMAKSQPDARITLTQAAPEGDKNAFHLFTSMGYQEAWRSWQMRIDFDGPPSPPNLPAGITIRPIKIGEEERQLLSVVHEAFRDHRGHIDESFEHFYDRNMRVNLEDPHFNPAFRFAALDENGEFIGACLCRPESTEDHQMGWVSSLGVRRPWRKLGVGMALLQYAFCRLYESSKTSVGLSVDSTSLTGATRLYERAGMRVIRTIILYEKELRSGVELRTISL